jgi:DNA-binding NarL/FixJ family response regulator
VPADVILIDIGLGQESGFDLAPPLADEPAVRAATVILISTHSEGTSPT